MSYFHRRDNFLWLFIDLRIHKLGTHKGAAIKLRKNISFNLMAVLTRGALRLAVVE